MGLRATVLAAAAVTGCAAEGEGLVIRIEGADAAVMDRTITHLELFVGRTGPDERFVRDYDPARDLYAVTDVELEGYRLFLRADVVPTDLEAVAIAGYTADPAGGAAPAVMALVLDPPFMPGELIEIAVQLEAVAPPTTAGSGERWAQRWGATPIEPVADHSCFAWGTGGTADAEGAIVRADDLDCDGTVPPTCDPGQRDPTLLEGAADVDGDGFGEWTDAACAACLVQAAPGDARPVRCDCDEADASRHFGASEVCDGVDNDCDPMTTGDFAGIAAIPCQVPEGGGACDMGVRTCTESGGLVQTPCAALPASGVACLDLAACQALDHCTVGYTPPGSALATWHCVQDRELGGALCGDARIAAMFAQIPIAQPPPRCSAALWGGDEPGGEWKVVLQDRTTGDRGATLVDVACDALDVHVELAPATNGAETLVILVIGDGAGTPLAAVPLNVRINQTDGDGCEADQVTVCTRN